MTDKIDKLFHQDTAKAGTIDLLQTGRSSSKYVGPIDIVLALLILMGVPGALFAVGSILADGQGALGLPSWAWKTWSSSVVIIIVGALFTQRWKIAVYPIVGTFAMVFISGLTAGLAAESYSTNPAERAVEQAIAELTHIAAWIGIVVIPVCSAAIAWWFAYDTIRNRNK